MKRNASLVPLSEHHHHALVQALEIARVAKLSGAERRARFLQAAESLAKFWETAGRTHFREEEDALLPALARHVRLDQEPAVMRMLADHAQIRAWMQDVADGLLQHRVQESQLTQLGQLLHDHVRLEEDVVFPRIESLLTEEEMRALRPMLTSLHMK